jgi:hypothetical protein
MNATISKVSDQIASVVTGTGMPVRALLPEWSPAPKEIRKPLVDQAVIVRRYGVSARTISELFC